jgi:hypothetical protein
MLAKNLKPFGKPTDYSEMAQTNPIRFVIYFKNEDGTFKAQTNEFKCKDYFNDIVAWYHDYKFTRYGMNFEEFSLNDDGVYVELRNLKPTFLENVNVVLGEEFKVFGEKVWFEVIEDRPTALLAFIPKKFFKCTYFISYLTLMLRNCNLLAAFTSPQDVFTTPNSDYLLKSSERFMKTHPLKDQTFFDDYWYFYDSFRNSRASFDTSSPVYIHNCGIVQWSQNFHLFTNEAVPA